MDDGRFSQALIVPEPGTRETAIHLTQIALFAIYRTFQIQVVLVYVFSCLYNKQSHRALLSTMPIGTPVFRIIEADTWPSSQLD